MGVITLVIVQIIHVQFPLCYLGSFLIVNYMKHYSRFHDIALNDTVTLV